MTKCTEQSFLKDVSSHQMTILRDDGVYRHVRFKKPGTNCMYFDLMTWPGWLCYSGDMGTFVFRRLEDMFEFFRTKPKHLLNEGCTLHINLGYWAEKVEAEERNEGVQKYSPEKFRERIKEWTDRYCENQDCDCDALRQEVEDHVLSCADECEQVAMGTALGFEFEEDMVFQDFWEVNLKEYTNQFVWCLYAIAWGIQQYDKAKSTD